MTETAASETSISLTWSAGAGATGYQLQRSTDGSNWVVAGTVAAVTHFIDSGLGEAESYQYRLMATNAVGNSAYCPVVICTTPPAAPTNLTVASATGNWIKLTWTDQSDRATGYVVRKSTGPNGPWTGLTTLSPNSSYFSISGPFDGSTTYDFQVSATVSGVSSTAAVVSFTAPAWPSAPQGLAVTARSATANDLSWSPSTGASGYSIQRSSN